MWKGLVYFLLFGSICLLADGRNPGAYKEYRSRFPIEDELTIPSGRREARSKKGYGGWGWGGQGGGGYGGGGFGGGGGGGGGYGGGGWGWGGWGWNDHYKFVGWGPIHWLGWGEDYYGGGWGWGGDGDD